MRINRGLLGWGVFLIVLGAIPLAVRGGYLDTDTVAHAWELWPLILIGIGLGLMLQRTQLAVVGGLVVAVTFGVLGGSLIAVGLPAGGALAGCSVGVGSGSGTPFETRTGQLGGSGTVDLDLNCGEITVSPASGPGWTVTGSDDSGKGPDITATADRLRIRSAEQRGVGFMRSGQRWQVNLPQDPSLNLTVAVNAGSGRLDLAGAHVPTVNLSVNAGSITADLSGAATVGSVSASANAGSLKVSLPAANVTGSLSVNAGSIEFCVPAGVGLRLRDGNNPLSSNNFGSRGLTRSGQTWTTSGYDSAATRIDLSTSANLGSITLNPEAGCD